MALFKPGQSGNPGGRPKVVGEVQTLARAHTAEAIKTLAAIMTDEKAPAAARALAADRILDRGFGRPAQSINATMTRRSIDEMTDEELMAIAGGADDDDAPDDDDAAKH